MTMSTASPFQQPSAAMPILKGPVTTTLNFSNPPKDASNPFIHAYTPPPDQPHHNLDSAPHSITLQDIRDQEQAFTLDAHGFEAVTGTDSSPSPSPSSTSADDAIRDGYYPEIEKLLLTRLPGAHRVVVFDHTVRRGGEEAPTMTRVRIDETPASAEQRVRRHVADAADAEGLLAGRVRIVSVWWMLQGPAMVCPVAIADGSSVRDEDLFGVEVRCPDGNEEMAAVRFNEGQRWLYWSGMGEGERLLVKGFDNDEDVGMAGRVPYSVFEDPRVPKRDIGVECIEVRALIFG